MLYNKKMTNQKIRLLGNLWQKIGAIRNHSKLISSNLSKCITFHIVEEMRNTNICSRIWLYLDCKYKHKCEFMPIPSRLKLWQNLGLVVVTKFLIIINDEYIQSIFLILVSGSWEELSDWSVDVYICACEFMQEWQRCSCFSMCFWLYILWNFI
jgi:hypothetical protein